MNYEPDELIKEYFKQVGDQYPDIDLRHFNQIVRAPFRFIAKCMAMDNLPTILVKNLGKFKVVKATIVKLLRYNRVDFREKRIDKDEYLIREAGYKKIIAGMDDFKDSKNTIIELVDNTNTIIE